MTKKMLIDATHAEETRVVVVDGTKVEEFDFETVNKRQLAGNIYLAKVTRVEPSLQAAFVDYGGNRHGFLAFSEIHPDYYQIPVADRQALLAEERAYARSLDEEEGRERPRRPERRPRPAARAEAAASEDAVQTGAIAGMDVVDLGDSNGADSLYDAAKAMAGAGGGDGDLTAAQAGETGAEAGDAGAQDHEHDHDHAHDHEHGDAASDQGQASDPGQAGDQGGDTATGSESDAGGRSERRYHAMDHASEVDDEIESIAEEDVAEEISQQRRPRARRYKIQEVVKVRQIMLVQVVKEERGNKGAALTTYLSLAGRYCVLMPNTARGGGISRKITNAADRKKLKEIAGEIEVPEGAGLIIRTAGSQRTKSEIKRDYEYLQRLWEQIRDLTLKSIAPAPIYEEGTLIKRVIRDLYNRDIEEVLVEGPEGYRVAKDFMRMIMPSHARNVIHYAEGMPLFARYGVESYLASMFNPTVQLKSGGYIVIGITEALVAIDVNSGRATKEGSIEETALKTNLEASEEIARQLRLRDLAGLIVIDFIDMEERKNNASVEKRLKDKLKTDRARIQVGRISGFGLMEMSRQRLRPGMLEASTAPCNHCHGTGLIRSDDSLALSILRQLEEEGTRKRSKEVLLKAPIAIVNFLVNQKREHIAGIEVRYGMAVRIEADPSLISPDFSIEKFKTATRVVAEANANVVSVDTSMMPDMDEDEIEEEADDAEDAVDQQGSERGDAVDGAGAGAGNGAGTGTGNGTGNGKKKRRRRRRRKGGGGYEAGGLDENGVDGDGADGDDDGDDGEASADVAEGAAVAGEATVAVQGSGGRSRSSSGRSSSSRSSSGRSSSGRESSGRASSGGAASDPSESGQAEPGRSGSGRSSSSRSRSRAAPMRDLEGAAGSAGDAGAGGDVTAASGLTDEAAAAKKPTRTRVRKPTAKQLAAAAAAEAAGENVAGASAAPMAAAEAPAAATPAASKSRRATPVPREPAHAEAATTEAATAVAVVAEVAVAEVVPAKARVSEPAKVEPAAPADDKPKKRGWWSLAR